MSTQPASGRGGLLLLVWLWVAVPFCYGLFELVLKVTQLFGG